MEWQCLGFGPSEFFQSLSEFDAAQEKNAAASITCDLCPIILEHVWGKMGATSKARDARSHHFIMSVLEDVCEEGETDGEPEFFQGYELTTSRVQDDSKKLSSSNAKPFHVRRKSAGSGADSLARTLAMIEIVP